MVLTNFELWAADGGSSGPTMPLDFDTQNPHNRHLNPFDTRDVPQLSSNHLSSNGYYGFSYINSAHDNNNNNNNNNNIINYNLNNNNIISSGDTTYNFMANDVNGINNTTTPSAQQQPTFNCGSPAYAAGHAVNNTSVARCKKRFFAMSEFDAATTGVNACTANNKNYYDNECEVSAKRCRFDDDFSAQYCNDFFQLPSTQIATQSCLMDTEETFLNNNNNNNNNNNIEKYESSALNPQLQTLDNQQQQSQHQQQPPQQQQQQQHLYHHQQHYQADRQLATIKCHFYNKYNNSCDTLALNNHTSKIDFEKTCAKKLKIDRINNFSIQSENHQYNNDHNDVDAAAANDSKVDDAMLFAQLHGGCLHHHHHDHQSRGTVSFDLNGNYMDKKIAMNHHLKDENFYEEF